MYKNFQIPPDLVVKSQGIDIIGLILPLIRGQNVVETSRKHMKSRFELLSPSKGNWFTTKSDGMWDFPDVLVGSMRVSNGNDRQTTDLQRDALLEVGVDPRQLFADKVDDGVQDVPLATNVS